MSGVLNKLAGYFSPPPEEQVPLTQQNAVPRAQENIASLIQQSIAPFTQQDTSPFSQQAIIPLSQKIHRPTHPKKPRATHPPKTPSHSSNKNIVPLTQQYINADGSIRHTPTYNVLLIGQSQSGKSTLLEAIKQYADTNYKADLGRIGSGNVSLTSEPRVEEVLTSLPAYKVHEINQYGHQEIDIEHHLEKARFDDFKSLLNRREGLEVIEEKATSFSRFRIIDTPGLDDSQGRDVEFLGRIFSILSSLGHLHLVIITDSHRTILAPGYQAALRTYSTLFSTMHGLMTFVMTNIPYKQQHPGRKKGLDAKLEERTKIISDIMGRRFPSFRIDCNLKGNRPFQICLTRNIIRDILITATIKTPVALKMQVHKTVSMKEVDGEVYRTYSDYFNNLQQSCDLLDLADRLQLEIVQTKAKIELKEEYLRSIDTDDLLHLHEIRYSQDWEHFYVIKPTVLYYSTFDHNRTIYPSNKIRNNIIDDENKVDGNMVETFEGRGREADGCVIDMIRTTYSAVDILAEEGGVGHNFWGVLLRRNSFKNGHYHAILSIKSRNKYRTKIDSLKREISMLKDKLENLEQDRILRLTELRSKGIFISIAVDPKTYQALHDRLSIYRQMMEATVGNHLRLEVFVELALSGIYHGGSVRARSEALERFWASKLGFDPSNHSEHQPTRKAIQIG